MIKGIAGGVVGAGVFALVLLGWHSYGEAPASYASLADSVVKVELDGTYGTGVIVAPNTVLTAAHVAKSTKGGVVETKDGLVFAIEKVILSKTMDMALIVLANPIPNAKVAKVSRVMPLEGDTLLAIGHPMGVRWGAFYFTFSGHIEDEDLPPGSLVITGASNPGLSGGPAFNTRGEAVGLVTHSINVGEQIRTGLALILPFASVVASEGDPVKEALGW